MSALFSPTPDLRLMDIDRDAETLHTIFSDAESCRYLLFAPFASIEETREQMGKWRDNAPDTDWTIFDGNDPRPAGRVTIYRVEGDAWDAGVMICPHAKGRGLARRALAIALDYGFEKKNVRRIAADIDPDNIPSIRTFEQLGFTFEGRLRANWKTHIGVRDSLIYSLLATDPRPWR